MGAPLSRPHPSVLETSGRSDGVSQECPGCQRRDLLEFLFILLGRPRTREEVVSDGSTIGWRLEGRGHRGSSYCPPLETGRGARGSVAITNACAGCGRAAISASPAGSWGVWGGGPWSPVLASETALGKRRDWPKGTTSSHGLGAQTSTGDGSGRILVSCSPVTGSRLLPPPRTHLCPAASLPELWSLLRFEFRFCKGNDLRSCQGLHPGQCPHSSQGAPQGHSAV